MAATLHFIQRAKERLGIRTKEAVALADMLVQAVKNEDTSVATFVTRVDRTGCRVFRFAADGGQAWYALVDTDKMVCVTILPPGFYVGRQGKSRLRLKECDL